MASTLMEVRFMLSHNLDTDDYFQKKRFDDSKVMRETFIVILLKGDIKT